MDTWRASREIPPPKFRQLEYLSPHRIHILQALVMLAVKERQRHEAVVFVVAHRQVVVQHRFQQLFRRSHAEHNHILPLLLQHPRVQRLTKRDVSFPQFRQEIRQVVFLELVPLPLTVQRRDDDNRLLLVLVVERRDDGKRIGIILLIERHEARHNPLYCLIIDKLLYVLLVLRVYEDIFIHAAVAQILALLKIRFQSV